MSNVENSYNGIRRIRKGCYSRLNRITLMQPLNFKEMMSIVKKVLDFNKIKNDLGSLIDHEKNLL